MSAQPEQVVHHLRIASSDASVRHVFVRDLDVVCSIGVYEHEHEAPQRVRINLDLAVQEDGNPINDDIANVVSYEDVVIKVKEICLAGHTKLVETLAEKMAAAILEDQRIHIVRIRIEKLDVFADAASVGVEIERRNSTV